MYYNIKIKSNGSEFSLESNNKEITQREMDMYFACIFDVSDEFKSNIKKIEIKNSNLKSIEEIENFTNGNILNNIQSSKKQIEEFTEQKNIQPQQQRPAAPMPIEQRVIKPAPVAQKSAEPAPVAPMSIEQRVIEQRQIEPMPVEQRQIEPLLNKNILQEEKLINEYQPKGTQQPQTPINNQIKFEELSNANLNIPKESLTSFDKPSEIKFENVSQTQFNKEQNSNYNDLSIKDFDLKLEEMSFDEDINIEKKENNNFINQEQQSIEINLQKPLKLIEQPNFEPLVKETEQAPAFQQEEKELNFDNSFDDIKQSPLQSEKPQFSEIDELISLAQDKINSFDINDNLNFKNFDDQPNQNSDTIEFDLKSDISYQKREVPTNDIKLQQGQFSEEKLNDIFVNKDTNEQNSQPSTMDTIVLQQNRQQTVNNQNQAHFNEIQTNSNQQIQEMPQGAYQQDFKLYLSEFNYENTAEIFLICAFYIKNILKQENFTMKFINSKLFQATGRIADMRVLDDLITKEYIRVIDSFEFKKYSITQDGEGYFTRRFQG